jgi:hypothetical protein
MQNILKVYKQLSKTKIIIICIIILVILGLIIGLSVYFTTKSKSNSSNSIAPIAQIIIPNTPTIINKPTIYQPNYTFNNPCLAVFDTNGKIIKNITTIFENTYINLPTDGIYYIFDSIRQFAVKNTIIFGPTIGNNVNNFQDYCCFIKLDLSKLNLQDEYPFYNHLSAVNYLVNGLTAFDGPPNLNSSNRLPNNNIIFYDTCKHPLPLSVS